MTQPERVRVRIVIEIDAPAGPSGGGQASAVVVGREDPGRGRTDPGTEGVPVRCLVVDGPGVGDGFVVHLAGAAPPAGQRVQIFYDGQAPKDSSGAPSPHFEPVARGLGSTAKLSRRAKGQLSAQGYSMSDVPIGAVVSTPCP